jgi:excisionase family DNA binding protein
MSDFNNCLELSDYPDLLTIEHLAEIFNVSKQTIYKEIKEGKFGTPIRIGRAIKIPRTFVLKKYFVNYQ